MESFNIQRSLILCVTLVLCNLSSSEAVNIDFTFRQATYVVAAIALFYVCLSLVILLVLCRVLNCRCRCHKGKVCPRISSEAGVVYKGNDYIEIEMGRYMRKKSMDSRKSPLSKLGSIPEETVLSNPMTIEEDDSPDSTRSHSKFETKTSVTTIITTIDNDDDELFGTSSSRSGSVAEQSQWMMKPRGHEVGEQKAASPTTPLFKGIFKESKSVRQFFGDTMEQATESPKTPKKVEESDEKRVDADTVPSTPPPPYSELKENGSLDITKQPPVETVSSSAESVSSTTHESNSSATSSSSTGSKPAPIAKVQKGRKDDHLQSHSVDSGVSPYSSAKTQSKNKKTSSLKTTNKSALTKSSGSPAGIRSKRSTAKSSPKSQLRASSSGQHTNTNSNRKKSPLVRKQLTGNEDDDRSHGNDVACVVKDVEDEPNELSFI